MQAIQKRQCPLVAQHSSDFGPGGARQEFDHGRQGGFGGGAIIQCAVFSKDRQRGFGALPNRFQGTDRVESGCRFHPGRPRFGRRGAGIVSLRATATHDSVSRFGLFPQRFGRFPLTDQHRQKPSFLM